MKGKTQSDVVALLKSSDRVALVISRQEAVDSQDDVSHLLSLCLGIHSKN